MQEKRNSRRMSLTAKLLIKNMHDTSDKPEEIEIDVLDAPLTIGAVYETLLKIWNDDEIHAFLKVVRIEQTKDEKYMCGTIFIGLPEMNAARIEVYELMTRIQGEE